MRNNRPADVMIASTGIRDEFGVLFVSGSVVPCEEGMVIGRVVLTGTLVVIVSGGRVVRPGVSLVVASGIPAGL